ncbi:MAG: hypothetical protein HQM16_16665 [Deltaproteobacteria bacterium]|nr:hypothetical protein [Deltaproteobacteria bacterium]
MGFECEEDARKVMAVLPKRFGKYGLTIHPDKTRLVPFGKPKGGRQGNPGTFDFLGFTHYWGKSWGKRMVVKRKTAKDRISRGLKGISKWCRKNRHLDIKAQYEMLGLKLKGHCAYYGITGNAESLRLFRESLKRIWRKWLDRRSRNKGGMTWEKFSCLEKWLPLPPARAVHSICVAKP